MPEKQVSCSVNGCEYTGLMRRGLCTKHYQRMPAHGDVNADFSRVGAKHSRHPMYGAWQQMIRRCDDPGHKSYRNYGAKGIDVSARWRTGFQNFLADMGERPQGMTLDRIDPYGNYEKANCRWADARTQRMNVTEEGRRNQADGVRRMVQRRDAHNARDAPDGI